MRLSIESISKASAFACGLAVLCGSLAAAPPVPGKMVAEEMPTLDESQFFGRVAAAINRDPRVHGAWVIKENLEADPQNRGSRFVLRILVDKSRAVQQEAAVRRLLDTIRPFNFRVGTVTQLPLSELIAQVNLEIEGRKDLDGCYVTGAFYTTPQFSAQQIDLAGHVATANQANEIIKICKEQMFRFPIWTNAQVANVNVGINSRGENLIIRGPSPTAAAIYYAQGVKHFNAGNVDEAAAKFQSAVAESPKEQVYRYWLILSELKRGRRENAYRHLSAIVRRGEITPNHDVYDSLQAVQGPLRMELVEMEANAKAGLPFSQVEAESGFAAPARNRPF